MNNVYESIMAGLQEALEDINNKGNKLPRRKVTVVSGKEQEAEETKKDP